MNTLCRILSLTLLISACLIPQPVAGKVKSYPDPKADFSHYKTYQWFPPRVLTKAGIDENHPAAPVLKEVVGRHLMRKGLSEVADGADLQIQAYVLTESVPQLEAVIFSMGGVYQGGATSIGSPVASVGRYNKEGSLYLNLIDSRTKKSAWFVMGSDSLPNRTLNPDEIRAKLDKVATAMFKKYPLK